MTLELIQKVKTILESKGWDFSSDYFSDEETAALYEVIAATEQVIKNQ